MLRFRGAVTAGADTEATVAAGPRDDPAGSGCVAECEPDYLRLAAGPVREVT